MADAEDEPWSRGGILLALVLVVTAIAMLVAAIATPDAPWAIAVGATVCMAVGAWVSPRLPGGGFIIGLGGGFCVLLALAFAEPGLLFVKPDCGGGCQEAEAAASARIAPFETIIIASLVVQGVLGAICLLVAMGRVIANRKELEPLPDHNEAQRGLPEARVVRDRRVE